ncbi:MAG: LrgB family protein [Firmicutes bacterium]|nr:LrgB family protein [Bacillota bacterium]
MNNILTEIFDSAVGSTYLGVCITIGVFSAVSLLASKIRNPIIRPLVNPLVCTLIILVGGMVLLNIPYEAYKPSGDIIAWFLTPATVSLAVPLYRQINVLKSNKLAILASVTAGSIASVVSIFIMCKLMKLPVNIHTSLSPKSVTTAIASSITEELGGIVACTVAAVLITGLLGAILVVPLKSLFRIRHDVSWGVACGTSGHAGGTATLIQINEVAGAMSSISITIAGIVSVVLVPIFVALY